jgi:3,4-dihydroxy 2-butanone 4-phosphate synthase/GTP cyclohydrolase II
MPGLPPLAVTRRVTARIPTAEGEFELSLYQSNRDDKEHLALAYGHVLDASDLLVRVHSECFTGDVLGSRRCDCGEQLHDAMGLIAQAGQGLVIYLRQEGRGIGLLNKLHAYNLQDQGYDTVEANLALGHQADEREYGVAALILRDLRVRSICLLTNNPVKIESLRQLGVRVSTRVPLQPTVNADNAIYLRTKAERMRHLLTVGV